MQESKVAPPQDSKDQKPTLSSFSAIGSMSSSRMRVASRDWWASRRITRSEEHTSELQSRPHLVCRLLLEKKNTKINRINKRKKITKITNKQNKNLYQK